MANWREGSDKSKPRGSKPPKAVPPAHRQKEEKKPGDWRGKKKAAAEPEAASEGGKRRTYLRESKKTGPRNIGILNLLLLLLVTLVISFVTILGCQPTKVPMMHMASILHDDPLWRPNAFGHEDRTSFDNSMSDRRSNIELLIGSKASPGTTAPKEWLNLPHNEYTAAVNNFLDLSKGPGGPKPGGWIFYLSCHGVTDDDGVPCLVAKDSRAMATLDGNADSLRLVKLEDILRKIAEHSAVKRHRKSFKLLVLDTGRIESQWNVGRPYNDFPSAVRNLVENLPVDLDLTNTFVMLSNDDGQKAWEDRHGRGTNFGQYFAEGLMGAADGEANSSIHDHISLEELFNYVSRNVSKWAQDNRNSVQTPVLIQANGQQTPLSQVMLARVGDLPFQRNPRSGSGGGRDIDLELVADLWSAFELLGNNGAARLCPVRFALAEEDLIAAEQLALGGIDYQGQYRELCSGPIAKALENIARYGARLDPALRRAILSSDLRFFTEGKLKEEIQRQRVTYGCLAAWRLNETTPPGELLTLAQLQELDAKLEAEKSQPDLPEAERTKAAACPDYYAAASHLMDDMKQQRNITSENLDLIFRYLETAPNYPGGNSGVHAVEVEFLQMVRNFLGLLDQDYNLDPGSDAMISLRNTLVKAIACRNETEELYTVPDERIFAWLQSELKQADETRRRGDDFLFGYRLNEANAQYDRLLGENGQLASLRKKEATLADAYRAHDAAGQSLPFLLEWIAHHPYPVEERQQMLVRATGMIRQVQLLGRALFPPPVEGELKPNFDQAPLPDAKLVADLTNGYRGLVSQLNRKAQDIIEGHSSTARSDSETVLEIYNLLRCRYVAKLSREMPTYDRNVLRKRLAEIVPTSSSSLEKEAQSPLLTALSTFRRGPCELLTGQSTSEGDFQIGPLGEVDLAACQTMLRKEGPSLSPMEKLAQQVLAGGTVPPEFQDKFTSPVTALATSAFSGIPVLVRDQLGDDTPSLVDYRTRRKDRFGRLAERALEDFWGNHTPGTPPYFDRLASLYLGITSAESAVISSAVTVKANNLRDTLREEFPQGQPQWCIFDNPNEHVSGSTDLVDHRLTIQIPKDIPKGLTTIEMLADGKAVEVGDSSGNSARGHLFPTQPESVYQLQRTFQQRFTPADIQEARVLASRIRFRGHEVTRPFQVLGRVRPDEVEHFVEIRPIPYRDPEVTVRGDIAGTGDVIFVIDCSGSMGFSSVNPTRAPMGRERNRMDLAKAVLVDVLDSMAEKRSFRVLLMAYGNRVGWDPADQSQMKAKPGTTRPPGIVPGNDVQVIGPSELALLIDEVPRQNQNAVDVSVLKDQILQLEPLGETPLYYSISEALKKAHPTNPTQIIVITDGENDQTASVNDPFRTGILAVEAELGRRPNVELNVVGFFLGQKVDLAALKGSQRPRNQYQADNQRRQAQAQSGDGMFRNLGSVDELAWVAINKGRGNFFSVSAQGPLKDAIFGLLTSPEYFSVQEARDPRSPQPLEFENWWKQNPNAPLAGRAPFTIRTHGLPKDAAVPVQLRGGEKLQLTYDSRSQRLLFDETTRRPLQEGEISVSDPVNGDGTYKIEIDHFLAPRGGVLEIPVRLKNRNPSLFTVRPYHIWAEITPSITGTFEANDVLETRYVSDLLLENETQFPEFKLRVDGWPGSAAYARVKLYVEVSGPIQPTRTIPLGTLLKDEGGDSEPLDTTLGKVRVEASETTGEFKYQVRVSVERGAAGLTPHHVAISPGPRRIRRSYFLSDESGQIQRIEHRFMYREKGEAYQDPPHLDLWTREVLTQKSPVYSADVQIPK